MKSKTFKRFGFMSTILLLVLAVIGCGTSTPAQKVSTGNSTASAVPKSEKTVVLKAVTAWEENAFGSAGYVLFKKKLEQLSNGRIKIQYMGGPEAIPANNQGEAVRSGVVDISLLASSYYANQVPEAAVLNYSELLVEEEWKSGAMDFLNEIHNKKLNVQLLGRASSVSYSIFMKQPINSISDFKGKRIRGTPDYIPFIKALGAEAVITPVGEVYGALERGVIDGVGFPESGMTDWGLQKQVKYQIFPSYYHVNTVLIMNLDKWKQLSKEDQDLINKVAREVEKDLPAEGAKLLEKEKKLMVDIKQSKLPEQEYLKISSDAAWNWVETNLPENGKKLKELFKKK